MEGIGSPRGYCWAMKCCKQESKRHGEADIAKFHCFRFTHQFTGSAESVVFRLRHTIDMGIGIGMLGSRQIPTQTAAKINCSAFNSAILVKVVEPRKPLPS